MLVLRGVWWHLRPVPLQYTAIGRETFRAPSDAHMHAADERDTMAPAIPPPQTKRSVVVIINLVSWLVLGAIAGWVAGYISTRDTSLDVMDIVLGIIGAFVGGWIASFFGYAFDTFTWQGVIVAIIGALILTFIWRFIKGRS
jgi:uncharacterized membrane protein YeaQ/YmgE (transglycosylase-associated protein family)